MFSLLLRHDRALVLASLALVIALLAYGAELIFTPADEGSDGAIRRVQALYAADPDRYCSDLAASLDNLASVLSAVKETLTNVNPAIQVDFWTFPYVIRGSLLRDRLMATLSGFFGILAAMLATVGLYGVISYMVARRRSEIGIRMALGASRRDILRLVLQQGLVLVMAGVLCGVALALALTRTMTTLLIGVSPTDALTFVTATLLLGGIGLWACYAPARRAMLKSEYARALGRVKAMLTERPDTQLLLIEHRTAICNSRVTAERIDHFLGGALDVAKMAAAIDPTLYRNHGLPRDRGGRGILTRPVRSY